IIGTKRVKKVLGRIRDAEGRISAEHEIFNPTEITGGGPHPEQYDLTSPHLKEIFQAVNNHYLGDNDEVDAIVFSGGSGKVDNHTTAAFDTDYRGRFENHEKATIEEGELFMTSKMFGEVKINSTSPLPNSPSNPTSQSSHYPEVQQKNQELNREGDNFDLLVEELLRIIEENQKI
ncbi:11610_t:CDS:2, partial [Funneliformis geosporum]